MCMCVVRVACVCVCVRVCGRPSFRPSVCVCVCVCVRVLQHRVDAGSHAKGRFIMRAYDCSCNPNRGPYLTLGMLLVLI